MNNINMLHRGVARDPYARYSESDSDIDRDTRVRVHPSITTIPSGVYHCNDYLIEVELPVGLREIGNSAFEYCSSMKQINLPDGLLRIGMSAFAYCSS